jgi:hypothetical protein
MKLDFLVPGSDGSHWRLANGRIQKYAPGVPGWKQVNINGFGDLKNDSI